MGDDPYLALDRQIGREALNCLYCCIAVDKLLSQPLACKELWEDCKRKLLFFNSQSSNSTLLLVSDQMRGQILYKVKDPTVSGIEWEIRHGYLNCSEEELEYNLRRALDSKVVDQKD